MAQEKKAITELTFVDNLSYYKEHTWAKVEGDLVKIGITDFAQDQLGDIIFIELPSEGDSFDQGALFGSAESAKTVSSLYMPISGTVETVNSTVEDATELVNNDPYGEGWIITVKPQDLNQINDLLTKEGYIEVLKQA